MSEFRIRRALSDDLPRLHQIREAAFAPVFASFRRLLGDELYELGQGADERAHGALLASLFEVDSPWSVFVGEVAGGVVGFVSVQSNPTTLVGEIGLNAVDPMYASRGYGTQLYHHALAQLREAGMKAAVVGTGADESHAPARRAYEKVGFDRALPTVWMYTKL